MRYCLLFAFSCSLATLGCGDDGDSPAGAAGSAGAAAKSALATLEPTMGNTARGTATFRPMGSQIKLTVTISQGSSSGVHAFHIHENPACGTDGMEAGGHWNPSSMEHGEWTANRHHLGDIGNITTDARGTGSIELTTDAWVIGTGAGNDVVNHAVILHANPDDFTTQPTGNAGGRIACGVIQLAP